jgi:hypothetical protein
MILPKFSVDDLKQLPLQALVAFAARCARRVQDLAELPDGHPGREELHDAVEEALRVAEAFAKGSPAPVAASIVEAVDVCRLAAGAPRITAAAATAAAEAARAAASAWQLSWGQSPESEEPWELKLVDARKFRHAVSDVTADLTVLNAYSAAMEAMNAVGYHNEQLVSAVLSDYDRLRLLNLGSYPDAGVPIDASPHGPLGPW